MLPNFCVFLWLIKHNTNPKHKRLLNLKCTCGWMRRGAWRRFATLLRQEEGLLCKIGDYESPFYIYISSWKMCSYKMHQTYHDTMFLFCTYLVTSSGLEMSHKLFTTCG